MKQIPNKHTGSVPALLLCFYSSRTQAVIIIQTEATKEQRLPSVSKNQLRMQLKRNASSKETGDEVRDLCYLIYARIAGTLLILQFSCLNKIQQVNALACLLQSSDLKTAEKLTYISVAPQERVVSLVVWMLISGI